MTAFHILTDKLCEVCGAIEDHCVLGNPQGMLARPRSLPGRSVAVEACPGHRYPVAESLTGVGEVAVPLPFRARPRSPGKSGSQPSLKLWVTEAQACRTSRHARPAACPALDTFYRFHRGFKLP